ncbi:hypothetical protein C6502_07950 [Candidatus Poribacteria bacterium]|nr:MAG: hypothetical protein C6502_07950 [Candidatus Poribacteria bacterium]
MSTRYKHTQIGYFLATVYSIVVLFLGYLNIMANFHPLTLIGLIIVLIVLGTFSRLTVTVDDQVIRIHFGLKIIRKTFPLKEIETFRVVKNPWYYGWGIRFTPRGWLFNVSGFSAIELRMKNGKLYRIGTDEPDNFAAALDETLNKES